jgi:hypothetical protein
MKNRDKTMIREISTVLTEDIIKMIEDMEKIQKANAKAARKARAQKREKARKRDLKKSNSKKVRPSYEEMRVDLEDLERDAKKATEWASISLDEV